MPGVCCTHFEGGDCQAIQGHCADGCAWEEAAWERLAAYEDTGLEPEEVAERLRTCKELVQIFERADLYNGIGPIEHICELSQAEKDGRLVVLPDAKYTEADGEKALQKAMWTCGNTNNPVTRYTADAIAEKLCREAKEENPPLTLKELCEMDGEPVWVESFIRGLASHWAIVHGKYLSDGRFSDDMERCLLSADKNSGYGIAWIAYRRKKDS